MRNLKKILALVLSLVMTFSVMSVASANFADLDDVKGTYADAVEILNAIGVFKGYENEDGSFSFKPENTITRAEVAAIIYRIDTGDVSDKQVKIYADYNKFEDVSKDAWYAGYVNYCANAEYVKGTSETTFEPEKKINGYQALAMILRVVGYDKNGEFTGDAWAIQVAKVANQLGITAGVTADTLGNNASRELIAHLLWRAMNVNTVTYTMLQGYNKYQDTFPTAESKLNPTINDMKFRVGAYSDVDKWGRPGNGYAIYTNANYETVAKVIVFHEDAPAYMGYTAITECDIATYLNMLGFTRNVPTYDNGRVGNTYIDSFANNKHDKHQMVGEQGTLIYVYDYADDTMDRIVLIDTYLAQVTETYKAVVDKAGHIKAFPYSDVAVYYGKDYVRTDMTISGNDFAKGSYLLVAVCNIPVYDENDEFLYYTQEIDEDEFLRTPATVTGMQTKIWWNAEKHTVDAVDYMDNVNFYLDEAGYTRGANFIWFLDEQNNVIGAVEPTYVADPAQYVVVHNVQWINPIGAPGYAQAKVEYMDGTIVENAVIYSVGENKMQYAGAFFNKDKTFDQGFAYTTWQYNLEASDTKAHLYQVVTNRDGSLSLTKVENQIDASVELKDGVSQIPDTNVYTDNDTLFVFWNDARTAYRTELQYATGYDNLPKTIKGSQIDYVIGADGHFADIVYIPYQGTPSSNDVIVEKFVYFTNESYMDVLLDENYATYFEVGGVIDHEGKTEALHFDVNKYGTEEQTTHALGMMVAMYKDTLVKVRTVNGMVDTITPVTANTSNNKGVNAIYASAAQYVFLDTGVVKFVAGEKAGLAVNVNTSTVIINEDGEGLTVNDLKELFGMNLYVVYKNTTASAIIVTDNTRFSNSAAFANLDRATLSDEVFDSLTYTVGDDTFADQLVYVVENSVFVTTFEKVTGADVTVTAEFSYFEAEREIAWFNVTMTVDGSERKIGYGWYV